MLLGIKEKTPLINIAASSVLILTAFGIEYYMQDINPSISSLIAYPLILVAITYTHAKFSIIFSSVLFQVFVLSKLKLQYSWPSDTLSLVAFIFLNILVYMISLRGKKKIEELEHKISEELDNKTFFVNSLAQLLKGSTQLIKASSLYIKTHPADNDKFRKSCDILFDKADSIDKAIYDLGQVIDLAKGEKLDFPLASASLRTITNQLFTEIHDVYKNKITLTINGDGRNSLLNEDAIKRALRTLMLSAIKFGKEHEQVQIHYDEDHSSTSIHIHTDSCSIDEHELKGLFSAFLCLQGKSTGADLRWAMSFSIAMGAIEAHSGKISVISNADEGLNYKILLPHK